VPMETRRERCHGRRGGVDRGASSAARRLRPSRRSRVAWARRLAESCIQHRQRKMCRRADRVAGRRSRSRADRILEIPHAPTLRQGDSGIPFPNPRCEAQVPHRFPGGGGRAPRRAVCATDACDHLKVTRGRTARDPRTRHTLIVDPATSARLSKTRQHGTAAELTVRRLLHSLGHRFRVNNRDLPGSPDIANRSKKWAVFVHGCFWHRHDGCPRTTMPRRNREFWAEKFRANIRRDRKVIERLEACGYLVLIVWECEANAPSRQTLAALRQVAEKRLS
jgi:DNA mismatch endonuclease (patch repair protein)